MKTSINTKIICNLLSILSYYALARNMSLNSLVQQKREHISCYVKAFMLHLLKAVCLQGNHGFNPHQTGQPPSHKQDQSLHG